jgi:SP family general alpha glucoside:H+ symporter-like MFS transporter
MCPSSVPWGMFATIGPAYASEICPLAFRPYLTAYINMCFAIGQLISAGVVQRLVDRPDEWAYRIPFGIQWIWPFPLLFIAWFMPESPWWLVQHGLYEEAKQSVERLMAGFEIPKAAGVVAMMIHTNNIEQEIQSGSSYSDCFRGSDRRRTEIACMVFAGQVLCGAPFAYSATYFFQQAGLSIENSYKVGLAGTAVAFVGTIASWLLMTRFGRRAIYLFGMTFMCLYLLIIGVLAIPSHGKSIANAQSALCIVWLLTFSFSAGPIGWTVPAEVSSTRLRSKTICLARSSYYICQITANTIQPYMLNPTEWNWRGKTGFFWFGFAFVTYIWAFFRMTETKGRSISTASYF